jgi:hypothetical protein
LKSVNGGGIAQEIDAAARMVYLKVQHCDADVSGTPTLTGLDGRDLVSVGGLINFRSLRVRPSSLRIFRCMQMRGR